MKDNKVEQYLIDLKCDYRKLKPNIWLLEDNEHEGMMVMYADPLVIIRLQLMSIPAKKRVELYEKLLELNASDMIRGAYGLEGDKIVIVESLEYETLDLNEFRAALDAIGLALVQHYPILRVYSETKSR
ncbi:MAG: YbjN domain-containing protein [Treponema sp.]|nr:YbjN domain-containing protein [Treponema sp.]